MFGNHNSCNVCHDGWTENGGKCEGGCALSGCSECALTDGECAKCNSGFTLNSAK